MTRKQDGLGLTALVAAGCIALLVVLIALATRDGAGDDSAAAGFPLVLGGLVVLGTLLAVGWRAATRRRAPSDR